MKTAEEIIKEFNKFEIESFDHHPINALSFEDCEKAMKLYANQKLDEAAEKAMVVYHCGFSKEENSMRQVNVGSNHIKADQQSILSLKDKV